MDTINKNVITEENGNFEYFINETEKTVVAVLTVPTTDIMEELCNVINKGAGSHLIVESINFHSNMLINGKYTGKAMCHPNDTFDVETGKKIAKAKAFRAYLVDRRTVVNRLDRIFENVANRVSDMKGYTDRSFARVDNRLISFT